MRAKQWVAMGAWGLMTFSAFGAGADEKNEKFSSCQADVEAFCTSVEAGDGRIRRCLKQHKDEISSECREQLAKGPRKSSEKKEVGTGDVAPEEAPGEEASTEAAVAPEESTPAPEQTDYGSGYDSSAHSSDGAGSDSGSGSGPHYDPDSYGYPSPR